jgi:aralkylamine N-acetyltransferase
LDFGEDPVRLVLSSTEGDEGSAEIVYRRGGTVSLQELERLCERVGWPPRPIEKVKGALENSFLVRAAHKPGQI